MLVVKEYRMKEFWDSGDVGAGISALTTKHYKIRKSVGNTGSYYDDSEIDNKGNLLVHYKVKPTFIGKENQKTGKKIDSVKVIDTKGNVHDGKKEYEIDVMFEGFRKLIQTKSDWKELTPKEKMTMIKWVIDNADVKFFSSSLDFLFQGRWKALSDIDSSIYKFPNLPDKGIWDDKHDKSSFISKHILEVIQTLKWNVDLIVKDIDKKQLKDRKDNKPKDKEPEVEEEIEEVPEEEKKESRVVAGVYFI